MSIIPMSTSEFLTSFAELGELPEVRDPISDECYLLIDKISKLEDDWLNWLGKIHAQGINKTWTRYAFITAYKQNTLSDKFVTTKDYLLIEESFARNVAFLQGLSEESRSILDVFSKTSQWDSVMDSLNI